MDIAKGAIVATLGPSSDNETTLTDMIKAGLDVVRLNLSHGTHKDCKKRFDLVRDVDDSIPILLDLSGPKIRIGELRKSVFLQKGSQFSLTREEVIGDETRASITYKSLIDEAEIGNQLFLNDGLIELKVIEKHQDDLLCEVISGGPLSSRKGINAPEIPIRLYAPTQKDIDDINFTISLEPDYYSVSFVRRPEDLTRVRDQIVTHTEKRMPLITKVEHRDAIRGIDQIIQHSDGIMVARGDLGVELPLEEIPGIQKDLVEKCNYYSRTCIVATQMLESMVSSQRPTRAEVSDVSIAVVQGADAVMLSAETATGSFPVDAIRVMNRIIVKTQSEVHQKSSMKFDKVSNVPESVARAAVSIASGMRADKILAFTRSGITSGMVSRFKPKQLIIAVTPNPSTARRTRIQWGVRPLLLQRDFHNTDQMIFDGINSAYKTGMIEKSDQLVIVAGSQIGLPSSTNLVQHLFAADVIASQQAKQRLVKSYELNNK